MRPLCPATALRVIAVALGLVVGHTARTEAASPEVELLRARIEEMRADSGFSISGTRIAARRVLAELYTKRGFAPEWTVPAARRDLVAAIRESAADGLDPEDYLLDTLERSRALAETAGASPGTRVDYDLLQSEALVRLLYHLMFGKVEPRSFDPAWNFTRQAQLGDPAGFVQEVIDSGRLKDRIEAEKPRHDMYRNLKAEYARLRAVAASGAWPRVPAGPTLKPGASDPRVRALRARLIAGGDLAGTAVPDSSAYDAALGAAVHAFQARHGLDADGTVGPGTLAALNVPIDVRIRTLRVNLERGRWLLNDLEPTFVVVNVAGYRVNYIREGQLVWSARAQVGKAYRATPIFRSRLTYLVLNPTWTVPPSILANDILPAQRRDPTTLARKGLEVIDAQGRRVPESSVDWANATPRNFRYMLRQPPGPDNALGRVKFMFPNSYSVYLHDTPSRNLFEKSERAFSSGCIRVEDPLRLAELLLEGQGGWNRAAIDSVIQAGKTRNVTLAHAIPVLLSYWTAWVDRDGTLQLRPDIYGRDAKVAASLAMPFGIRRRSP